MERHLEFKVGELLPETTWSKKVLFTTHKNMVLLEQQKYLVLGG